MGLEVVKTIGVMLACYNGGRYLPQQLQTLRTQDDRAFTVLMQDDGSTDGTLALLEAAAAADARFRLAEHHGQHLGAKGNFLSLMAQDQSDYTALCDQDDLWDSDKLSTLRAEMERLEALYGVDTPLLVHSDSRVVDAEGRVLHESFFAHQGWDKTALSLRRLMVQNNVTGCTLMMNAPLRRLVVKMGRAEQMYMHDWFIALTAAAFGHVAFVDRPLSSYRQHGTNVMGASGQGLARRGMKALAQWQKGKDRIALTYRHTRAFRLACAGDLPHDARQVMEGYLATEKMCKLRRVWRVQRMGCTMQSPVTRMGQIIFG